jgi:hypothetical protein
MLGRVPVRKELLEEIIIYKVAGLVSRCTPHFGTDCLLHTSFDMPSISTLPQLGIRSGTRVPRLPPTPPPTPVKETQSSIAKLVVLRWFFKLWCQVARNVFGCHSPDTCDLELTSWSESMSSNGGSTKSVGCNSPGEPVESTDNLSILADTTA